MEPINIARNNLIAVNLGLSMVGIAVAFILTGVACTIINNYWQRRQLRRKL